MIKLCYKEYDWKVTTGACERFQSKTGLDLKYVFGDYIQACIEMEKGASPFIQMQIYAKLHTEKTAVLALHSIIKARDSSIPLDEVADAASRVGWLVSERPDDLSEPWPFVMLNTALQINEYYSNNIPKKKVMDTGAD